MGEFAIRAILSFVAAVSFFLSEVMFIYWIGGMNTLTPSLILFMIFLTCVILIIKKFRVVEEF